jgi:2-phosphoglycerate kinase
VLTRRPLSKAAYSQTVFCMMYVCVSVEESNERRRKKRVTKRKKRERAETRLNFFSFLLAPRLSPFLLIKRPHHGLPSTPKGQNLSRLRKSHCT